MALPPGGFIMLAFIIVGKRMIDNALALRKKVLVVSLDDEEVLVD